MSEHNSEQELAERVAAKLLGMDNAARMLGIEVVKVAPGFAELKMTVRSDMLNGFGIVHGGITFSLADTAFACACNSRNRKTLALACNINYIAPVNLGDTLVATAREMSHSGRAGIYDVDVANQNGTHVARFRGTSYATSSPVIES